MLKFRFRVSPERYPIVLKDISEGSEPEFRFYIMVAVSTMIASFGLITNSTAVIIGAMLVAPLMTPIFGIALGLIRGDGALLGKAVKAEIAGVAAAVFMGLILGYLYPALEATPEMLSRTEPHLFDLLVAIFSGFAGAYALLDEKISPALPGVAIATAIVPPLANTGLCFSVGQYIAGVGSFILFFANFLSILLVASAVFWLFGMSGGLGQMSKEDVFKRFSLPIISFLFVATFLTHTLIKIAHNQYIHEAIETTLKKELLGYPDTGLDSVRYDEQDKKIYVLANIHSARILTPTQVTRLQKSLRKEIQLPTELIVRNTNAREISALGTNLKLRDQQLDGSFITQLNHPRVRKTKIADTMIRDFLNGIVGMELDSIRIYQQGERSVVVASVYGIVHPSPQTISMMESRLREQLNDPEVTLFVSFIESKLYDRSGILRLEFSGLIPISEEQKDPIEKIVSLIKEEIALLDDFFITGVNYNLIDDRLYVLVEMNGQNNIDQKQVKKIEEKINANSEVPVSLYVYIKKEAVVTSEGDKSYLSVSRTIFQKQQPAYSETIRDIIEASNL